MSTTFEQEYLGKTLAFRRRANTVLAVHATAPSDDEWLLSIDAVCAVQASNAMASVVAVSLVPEAVPTTQQRTAVSARVDQQRVRIALIGGGRALRMVVKAFSLFYPQTKAFALDEIDVAMRFASGVSPAVGRHDLDDLAQHFGKSLSPAG